ncbi:MAG: type II toxin-antitoxin system VapC family toxin [Spirochaetaceae bacterium]|nr:type II toxin-antitoxin system VapC family toxin [Spirochaetaceae bacterium]
MSNKFMLDTDICSYIIKQFNNNVVSSYNTYFNNCYISAVTYGELQFWVLKRGSEKLQSAVQRFLEQIKIIALDENVMQCYAEVRFALERDGTPVDNMDMMIAASALAHKITLVTNNTVHFSRIPKLVIENWL